MDNLRNLNILYSRDGRRCREMGRGGRAFQLITLCAASETLALLYQVLGPQTGDPIGVQGWVFGAGRSLTFRGLGVSAFHGVRVFNWHMLPRGNILAHHCMRKCRSAAVEA